MQVTIRGINTGRDAETNFALVVDGVLQTNPNALNQELSGVTQIEIVKGPQGALYGRNAVAGALIMTTRKPGEEWDVDLTAGIGSDSTYKGSIYAGGPIGGNASGSLSAYTRKTDGQWENLKLDCDDCVDKFEEYGVDGPAPVRSRRRRARLQGEILRDRRRRDQLQCLDRAGWTRRRFSVPGILRGSRTITIPLHQQRRAAERAGERQPVAQGRLGPRLCNADRLRCLERPENFFLTDGTSGAFSLYAFEATGTCPATNDANLTDPGYEPPFFGIPSSIWFTPAAGGATGFLPPYSPTTCDGYQYQQRDQQDASIELRLTSPGDQRLRWVGGVYFADIDRDVVVSQGGDLGRSLVAIPSFRPAVRTRPTCCTTTASRARSMRCSGSLPSTSWTTSSSPWRRATTARTARSRTTCRPAARPIRRPAAPRRRVSRSAATRSSIPRTRSNPAFATGGIPDRSETFEEFAAEGYRINWELTDDFALFASYGYGFRSGGFNSSGSAATAETSTAGSASTMARPTCAT